MNTPAFHICRKWIELCGVGFHPDTRGADYSPPFPASIVKEYDADMARLFALSEDPYEASIAALHDRFPDMVTHHLDNATEVELVNEDGSIEWTGPFSDFLASNKMDGLEAREIENALAVDGEFYAGGGALAGFHLRMVQDLS